MLSFQSDNYVVVEVEVCAVLTVPLTTATEVFIVPRTTGSATGGARVTFVYQNFTCNLNFAICLSFFGLSMNQHKPVQTQWYSMDISNIRPRLTMHEQLYEPILIGASVSEPPLVDSTDALSR